MQQSEKSKLLNSFYYPALIVGLMWLVKVIELISGNELVWLGVFPLKLDGLTGIVTAPFIHADMAHLTANSFPMLVLGSLLFYVYRSIAWRVLVLSWILTGFWVWVLGRESYHIGASGVVYSLAFFLFFSGIFRKDNRLLAVTFLVAFLYGSMVWGIFPELFPQKNISWESHLMGMVAGIVLAYFYRNEGGPERKLYSWEMVDEPDEDDDPDAYWKVKPAQKKEPEPGQNKEVTQINYVYRESSKPEENTDQSPKSSI